MAAITAQELATELGTDGRTVRKFLRSVTPKENQPGKGARWSIEKKNLRTLRKQYAEFEAAQAARAEVAEEEAAEDEATV